MHDIILSQILREGFALFFLFVLYFTVFFPLYSDAQDGYNFPGRATCYPNPFLTILLSTPNLFLSISVTIQFPHIRFNFPHHLLVVHEFP